MIDQFLRQRDGRQKCYVDTGPMLERDHAAAAGIGWHGKSTMLLNRELGTWFFLAEILTTLEFAPDTAKKIIADVARVASMPARPARLLRRTKWMRDAAFPI